MSQALLYIIRQAKSKYQKEVVSMESRRYWHCYGEMKKRSPGRPLSGGLCPGDREGEIGRNIFIHGGRPMSLEVYLAVPTFIRRGLAINR